MKQSYGRMSTERGPQWGGVGHADGWVMQGWGGPCRGGVGDVGVEWVMQGWGRSYRGGVSHAGVGWGGSCRGGVGPTGVGWVMLGWAVVDHAGWVIQGLGERSYRGGVGHVGVGCIM